MFNPKSVSSAKVGFFTVTSATPSTDSPTVLLYISGTIALISLVETNIFVEFVASPSTLEIPEVLGSVSFSNFALRSSASFDFISALSTSLSAFNSSFVFCANVFCCITKIRLKLNTIL